MTVMFPLRRSRRAWWTLSLLLLLSGCDNTASVDPSNSLEFNEMSISTYEYPTLWALGSTNYRQISLELTVPDDVHNAILSGDLPQPEVVMVMDAMGAINSTVTVRLFDDGGNLDLAEQLGDDVDTSYMSRWSGDLVPNDFSYSILLNSQFTDFADTYWIMVHAFVADSGSSGSGSFTSNQYYFYETVEDSIVVTSNSAPVVNAAAGVLPDSLFSGFSQTLWSVGAIDPDEADGDSVAAVNLTLMSGGSTLREQIFSRAENGIWTLEADSSFAAGLVTGDHTFRITATDLFGQSSAALDTVVWVENGTPLLADPDMPDTVVVPTGADPNLYTLSLRVIDPQSQSDIQRVFYEVIDPTDNHYTHPDWVLTDSGEEPDDTAHDGIWSAGISTESGNTNLGVYHFLFFAEDRGGNLSDTLDVPITMVSE